jgi:hypothetical protein
VALALKSWILCASWVEIGYVATCNGPVNANEAEARRVARFIEQGHKPGRMTVKRENPTHEFTLTLDLRRQPDTAVAFEPATQAQPQAVGPS